MNDIKRKLTSRKLWLALAGVATGVFLALGGDASEIQTVAGSITALASALAYILTEGKIDAAAVRKEGDSNGDGQCGAEAGGELYRG